MLVRRTKRVCLLLFVSNLGLLKNHFSFKWFPVWNRLPKYVINSNVSVAFAERLSPVGWPNLRSRF